MQAKFLKSAFPVLIILVALALGMFFVLRSGGILPKGAPKQELRSDAQKTMKIQSSAFENNQTIPKKYTCDGENINPPLEISGVPAEAQSLALIVHDPDAMAPGGWTHWVVFNIDPATSKIDEKSFPADSIEGTTSAGKPGYGGPCPPSGAPHHYQFKLYALDTRLALGSNATKTDVEHAIEGHISAEDVLVGLYGR